jgi:hypothetical protein
MDWNQFRQVYSEHGIVLVLGAGVSFRSGLPTWSGLLETVANGIDGSDHGRLFRDLRSGGVPLPVIASVLEERSGTRGEFIRRIREALYSQFPFFPEGVTEDNREAFVEHVRTNNLTMRSVAGLLVMHERQGSTYTANPLVHAVVTFNLDGVLQEYVEARYSKALLRTIDRASAQRIAQKPTSIYHMHGFLRFDKKAENLAKNSPDLVVLTEQDYFDDFGDPTSLFNYTFLYLLREWSCLFVGLSMQDENIRRLLHVSKRERMQGLLAEGEKTAQQIQREVQRHVAILKRSGTPHVDRAVEESLHPLGTAVLWIDDHTEHEACLRQLYSTKSSSWNLGF